MSECNNPILYHRAGYAPPRKDERAASFPIADFRLETRIFASGTLLEIKPLSRNPHMEVRMQESVLTLGERIVLAARLAAIEHVRREMEAAEPTPISQSDNPISADLHKALSSVFRRALRQELSGELEAA